MALHHDLKNILTYIKGYTFIARKTHETGISPFDPHLLPHLAGIDSHVEQLGEKLEQMKGLYELTHQPLDDRKLDTREKRGYEQVIKSIPELHDIATELHVAAQTMHDLSGFADQTNRSHLPEVASHLHQIYEHSQHLFDCVTDLKDAKVKKFQLNAVLDRLRKRYASVRIHAPKSELFMLDREKLVERMIENAIKNAIKVKATVIRIDISTNIGKAKAAKKGVSPEVEVNVSDNGPGIPAERHVAIFNPGITYSTAPDEEPGKGMGLAFARSVAQNSGGVIELKSDPNRLGKNTIRTEFTFKLPLTGPSSNRTGRNKRS
ncbi:ATP-binding protein [Candidatus Micrarchaeota archaeon]|nr:ATP-binding protein [Candidatus Micrarchaeota archaeon]